MANINFVPDVVPEKVGQQPEGIEPVKFESTIN